MKKLIVDDTNCIGCGACVGIDSKHFDFNESGLSHAISQENLDDENLNQAIAACPVEAIKIINDDQENTSCENDECGDNCHCNNCECDNCECQNKAA